MFQPTRKAEPPKIVLYGERGIGKTTFAASVPNCALVLAEDGAKNVDGMGHRVQSFGEIMEALKYLGTEQHDFRAVALDSLDWVEQIIHSEVCSEHGKNGMADFDFGEGYKHAGTKWAKILAGLDRLVSDRRMAVILLAQQNTERVDDPIVGSYDRYAIKVHWRASAPICEWADAVLFATQDVQVVRQNVGWGRTVPRAIKSEGASHIMLCQKHPSHEAKNRYNLPPSLPLSWPSLVEAIKEGTQKK